MNYDAKNAETIRVLRTRLRAAQAENRRLLGLFTAAFLRLQKVRKVLDGDP
jgi:hypothetical protein